MKFRIYTRGIPLAAVLWIETDKTIQVTGYNPNIANTAYFSQRITPEYLSAMENRNQVKFNLPQVPGDFILVDLADEGRTTSTARLRQIFCVPLKRKALFLPAADEEYFKCAQWFSENCGNMALGNYQRGPIHFEYVDEVVDPQHGPMATPAQVDHETGVVTVAKKYFQNYTVPMRMFILMHERVHYVLNTENESEADINALNICLSAGYPKMEMLYAATKIFPDTVEARHRLATMVEFIEQFRA